MKYLVDEFANIKNQIFQPSITVDIFYSNLCIVEAAPKHGGRPQPKLLPHLQQTLHDRRASDGAHEVCSQGPQCLWGAR